MRTMPAFLFCLLTPLLALAQAGQGPNLPEQAVTRSPLFWYWVVAIAIAVGAFIWTSITISRRKGGPPSRPRIS
ncbi:hypothetical protein [Hyalangium rubrum]|uniref:CcmD family protein n=1 Tax=Hyalangium rubrum TaxID=3103134 RepID=A0ABU5HFX1_9BACT|nr:hypothetical protein [Hyalangium sp. s54d21]MDY7231703.1 hypothetical protein [Hyalangium sp. s54d21]